jgi:hypothetical protein
MDSWNPDQLKKMQCGGNGKVNAFFQQYGVDKHTDIKDKYNSRAAEVCAHAPHHALCRFQHADQPASLPRSQQQLQGLHLLLHSGDHCTRAGVGTRATAARTFCWCQSRHTVILLLADLQGEAPSRCGGQALHRSSPLLCSSASAHAQGSVRSQQDSHAG